MRPSLCCTRVQFAPSPQKRKAAFGPFFGCRKIKRGSAIARATPPPPDPQSLTEVAGSLFLLLRLNRLVLEHKVLDRNSEAPFGALVCLSARLVLATGVAAYLCRKGRGDDLHFLHNLVRQWSIQVVEICRSRRLRRAEGRMGPAMLTSGI